MKIYIRASYSFPGDWYVYRANWSIRDWKYFRSWREAMDYVIKDLSL